MPSAPSLLFPPFRLDLSGEQLWRDRLVIALRPKTFAVLRYLAEHPGQLASKDDLLDAVWGAETAISDSVLKSCVRELRQALGDDARTPQYVETVHRRGYRFIADVRVSAVRGRVREDDAAASDGLAPSPSLASPVLVGRERELKQLHEWYAQAQGGQRRVVFVAGEAGIGKTALADAFIAGLGSSSLAG